MKKDASRARKDMSPLNLNVLRKTALILCKDADFDKRLVFRKNASALPSTPSPFFLSSLALPILNAVALIFPKKVLTIIKPCVTFYSISYVLLYRWFS